MKKIVFVFLLSVVFVANAQQTPQEIANILKHLTTEVQPRYDHGFDSAYNCIYQQISIQKGVNQAIWNSYMADLLDAYYQENKYNILDRTRIEGYVSDDFKTWDMQTLVRQIVYYYLKSIENKELLQKENIQNYAVLLKDADKSVAYRPTFYDLLAHRALDYLSLSVYNMPVPIVGFDINNPLFLSDNERFVNLNITSPDSLSFPFYTLKIMQELTKFHLQKGDTLALIDISLIRLDFVKNKSSFSNRNELYLQALELLEITYRNKTGYEDICYNLGNYYKNRANLYDPQKTPEYQWDYKTALSWYEKAIDFAPKSIAANNAKIQNDNIKKVVVSFNCFNYIIPNEPSLITYSYQNTHHIYCRIIPISYNKKFPYNNAKKYSKLLSMKYLAQWEEELTDKGDYQLYSIQKLLPALPIGRYVILISPVDFAQKNAEGFSDNIINVTNINALSRKNETDVEYLFSNRITGEPLKNIEVTAYFEKYTNSTIYNKQLYTTNEKGIINFPFQDSNSNERYLVVKINNKQGYFLDRDNIYNYTYNTENENVFFFIDRTIYRPEQTVYFKGIVVKSAYKTNEIVPNKEVEIIFEDANYQEISKVKLTTNEYGSFAGSFLIPSNNITGNYTISCKNGQKVFSVEEYKIPNFEVLIDSLKGNYKLNQKITVTGKAMAYAGYSLDKATVKYRVTQRMQFPFYDYSTRNYYHSDIDIANGQIITDNTGAFSFSFPAMEDSTLKNQNPLYNYLIYVDITDVTGETHSQTTSFSINSKNIVLAIDFPDAVSLTNPTKNISISTTNQNGMPIPATLSCELVQLEHPKRYLHPLPTEFQQNIKNTYELQKLKDSLPYFDFENQNDKSKWKIKETKFHTVVASEGNCNIDIPNINSYQEGYYKIMVSTTDTFGIETKEEHSFFIYQEKGNKCIAYEPLWLQCNQSEAEVGDELTVYIGSYLPTANIYFEVISNDSTLHSQWLHLEQGATSYSLKINEAMRGKLTFYAFLGDMNITYNKQTVIDIPFTNKKIDFEFITFRNKLQPGAKEEWKIKIKEKNGEKLYGELLCSMYDVALDAFKKNKFNFYINYLYKVPSKKIFSNTIYKNYWYSYYKYLTSNKNSFVSRDYYFLYYDFSHRSYFGNRKIFYTLSAVNCPTFGENKVNTRFFDRVEMSTMGEACLEKFPAINPNTIEYQTEKKPLPRTNFQETAFFYPQLQTDADGNVVFSFTMPESLTKWKFQGIAHTKDLRIGTFEKFVQTQKPLMVVPNEPRFFREGDEMYFSAKVVNMSDTLLTGTVSLELFNAQTNEKLAILADEKTQKFTAKKGESQEVKFKITIPFQVSAITYRIMASAEVAGSVFSDGEEKVIPVLSNRMLVTESMPLSIGGEQTKTFTFKEMTNPSPTLTPFKLTLEFTSNPVWYAIQALPYMMEYPYECNEQLFSRMYANSIATSIANSSPKIKAIFDTWKNLTPDAFCSALEKNQELKSIVLQETPWVIDAQSESANKQRVGLLFDINRMAQENKTAVNKLEKSQNANGSWSWFAGGEGNCYITQYIVAGIGHLEKMNISCPIKDNTLRRAIAYLDNQMKKEYYDYKKHHPKEDEFIGYTNLNYLYSRSFYLKSNPISPSEKEAYTFFLNQTKKSWKTQSLYIQALTALVVYRNGDVALAQSIINDIKNRAQYSDEMGMFWKKEGYGFYWHEAPIERQAVLIEAFQEILKDDASVEKMKTWLLKQKQTQNWGTTKATAEACYALLLNNQQLLSTDEKPIIITLGKTVVDASKVAGAEAGSGYFKTSWNDKQIDKNMANITINKPSKGVAWGGVYWQYFENLDKIVQNKDIPHPLSLRKSIFKVTLSDRGEVLTPITENNPIKVGDKVRIRIEIRADRDMEYVHLKDMRASAFELVNVFSQYKYQDGLFYYESTRDAATHFFFDYLRKGTYVFEYTVIATQIGSFSNGISSIECMYAPEFSEHTEGIKVKVE